MKRILLFAVAAVLGWTTASAQLVQVVNEVVMDKATFDATYPLDAANYPAGGVTYRIYAELQDANDFVTSVPATAGCYSTIIGANNRIWNSAFGAVTGSGVNFAFLGVFPSAGFDSFVTIGSENSATPAGYSSVQTIASVPAGYFGGANAWNTAPFGNDMNLTDGVWFVTAADQNGFGIGPNNRVLIAQVTTDDPAALNYSLNVQVLGAVIGGAATEGAELYIVGDPASLAPSCTVGVTAIDGTLQGLVYPAPTPGCTNNAALNFDPAATVDDGSCIVPACPATAWSYCYDNGLNGVLIVADGADPIILEILAGVTEATFDFLSIYDGSDNTGALLYSGDGDHTGVIVQATSGNMFIEIDADTSFSCQGGQIAPAISANLYCGTEFVVAGPANDDCANAVAITVDGGAVAGDNTNATPDGPIIGCGAGDIDVDGDVWFSFVAPAGGVEIETFQGTNDDTQIQVLDACGGVVLGCDDDNATTGGLFMSQVNIGCPDIVAGNTYFIQVDGWNGTEGTFTIEVRSVDILGCTDPGALNYDACANVDDASCIYDIPGCTNNAALNYNPAATVDDGSCIIPACAALPFSYCYTNGLNQILIIADGADPIVLEIIAGTTEATFDFLNIYDGSDNTGALLYSADGDHTGVVVEATSGNLFIEIDADTSFSCSGGQISPAIDANIYCGAPAIPGCTDIAACNYDPAATIDDGSCLPAAANDNCANADAVTVDGGAVLVDNSCATPDGPNVACGLAGDTDVDNDVWYAFVMPNVTSGSIIIETSADGSGTLTDTQIQLLDACGGNILGCDDDEGANLFSLISVSACDLTPGATYYIQVDGWGNATPDSGTCNLTVSTGDLAGCTNDTAINYDPCATIDDGSCIGGLPPSTALASEFFPNCTGVASGTQIPGAGSGLPSNGPFGGNTDDEVFFSVVAPCNGGLKAVVDGDPGFDAVVELLDGTLSPLDAADATLDGGVEFVFSEGIVAGQTYFVRVYDWFAGATGTFSVCVTAYCASQPDQPYPSLVYDACDVYKCDYIPGASSYSWTFAPQGAGSDLTYTSPNNNTFVNLSDLSGPVQYGETYDVTIDVNYTGDPQLGNVTISGVVSDVCVMQAEPLTELRADFVGGTYALNAQLRCVQSCGAESYIWRITPAGGSALPDVTVAGSSTLLGLASVTGLLPGGEYTAEIAVVYGGTQYGFGPAQTFFTAPAPLVEVRSADWCSNAGPLAYGYYIRTNVFAPGADDYTWEFTNTNGTEPAIYWRKGDGVRLLQLSAVVDPSDPSIKLLAAGESYFVRVKPEYGNFISGGNDNPAVEPQYDFATSYGATQEICLVGVAPAAGGSNEAPTADAGAVRADVAIEAAIYPNPNTGEFLNLNLSNISEDADKVLVDIYDLFGKLVQSEQIATTGTSSLNVVISLNKSMASGLYMMNITVGEQVQTERLVIEK